MSLDLRRRLVVVKRQVNDWDEPYKSRGLRTVLWAAGGEIPPADPATVAVNLKRSAALVSLSLVYLYSNLLTIDFFPNRPCKFEVMEKMDNVVRVVYNLHKI